MNRLSTCLDNAKENNRKLLAAYIVNGDPNPHTTLITMHEMVANGVDIIELGVPFSDPMAEGPVIQLGHERALTHNTSLKDTLATVSQFRTKNTTTPIILMGYANPIECLGYANFSQAAANAGVDGIITVDLPPEELGALKLELDRVDIKNIFLLAPTTTLDRAKAIVAEASGFLYYVSLKGVTGAGHIDVNEVKSKYAALKSLTDTPIFVGFGIKEAATANALTQFSDGIVIGSLLVKAMGEMENESPIDIAKKIGHIIFDIRSGIDSNI